VDLGAEDLLQLRISGQLQQSETDCIRLGMTTIRLDHLAQLPLPWYLDLEVQVSILKHLREINPEESRPAIIITAVWSTISLLVSALRVVSESAATDPVSSA
jgi:hypothetical protein